MRTADWRVRERNRESSSGIAEERHELELEPTESSLAKWTILSVTTLSAFMAAVDTNIVALALPKIATNLGSGVSILGWVVTGYILASVTLLLQSGRIGDKYGRKKIYLAGFALFGIGSALCGLSQTIEELIGFRVLQGAAASMLTATTTPLVFESFPPRLRGTAIGVISTTWAIGAVAGPVLGGFLVALDWRLIFYVNVPVAAAGVLIGTKKIPSRHGNPSIKGLNAPNSILLGTTVASAFLWLTLFDGRFAAVSLAAFVLLIMAEWKSANPLLNVQLRKSRGFLYSVVALGISQIAYLGIPFALSFYFQSVLVFSPIAAGVFIAPLSIALTLGNPAAGRLFDRMKYPATLALLGIAMDGVAMIILGVAIAESSPPLYLSLLLVAIGVGGGLVWTPLISTVLKFASPDLRGVANGTAITLVNVGYGASIAITVAVSATLLPQSVVAQIYLGNFGSLTSAQAVLFGQGIARAVMTLGVVNFVVTPFIFLVLKEQRKHF